MPRHPVTYKGDSIPYAQLTDAQRELVDSARIEDRQCAAIAGWGEDVLRDDESAYVRDIIAINSRESSKRFADLPVSTKCLVTAYDEPDKNGAEVWPDVSDRLACATMGYAPEVMYQDPDERVRAAVAATGNMMPELLGDPSKNVRIEIAKRGYGLATLAQDEAEEVRAAVAKQGFAHGRLYRDESCLVRLGVATCCTDEKIIEALASDPVAGVRAELAERGLCDCPDSWLTTPKDGIKAAIDAAGAHAHQTSARQAQSLSR